VLQNDTKQSIHTETKSKAKLTHEGKVLFTHFGVSGPTILNMSRDIGELVKYGDTYISLDILPQFDHGTLNKKFNDLFREESNKKFKNCVSMISDSIPKSLWQVVVEKTGINPDTFAHSITREDRLKLIDTCKNFKMKVKGLLGKDKAIVSSGGVSLTEIEFKTMRSKIYDNLYIIGDVLDIDRPSGGYSLQLCWTTGFVAGDDAGKR
jgi:predicted Rossmann fold flavoprotein